MRAQFILFAALAVIPSTWSANTCAAQDAKPAKPLPEAPKPQIVEGVPLRAAAAVGAIRLLPAMPRGAQTGLPFDLSNLVLAKFDESPKGPQLVALVEQSRTEQKTVAITRLIQEVRTRKVKVVGADGKESEVDQEYTVSIPVTENVDRAVQVPAGKKPTAFPLDDLRIYRLDGTQVSQAEARKLLEKISPVFLLRGFTGDIKAVEGVYRQALNPNCLIVVTEKTE